MLIGGIAVSSQSARIAQEKARQDLTGDDQFLREHLCYFELRTPPSVVLGTPGPYFLPLVLPPQSKRISEPFSTSKTKTTNGGLFVAEAGVVMRTLSMSGDFGVLPKRLPKSIPASDFTAFRGPESRSHSRVHQSRNTSIPLSGQKHLQYLQDFILRTYADLKNDPTTNAGTELYFHDLHEGESWRCIPDEFSLDYSVEKGLAAKWSFEATLLPPSADAVSTVEDSEVIEAFSDPISSLRAASAEVDGALRDLAALESSITIRYARFAGVLADARSIATSVGAVIDGSREVLSLPARTISLATEAIDAFLLDVEAVSLLAGDVIDINLSAVARSVRRLRDGYDLILAVPENFASTIDIAVARFLEIAEAAKGDRAALLAAEAGAAPTTAQALREAAIKPGDRVRTDDGILLGRNVPRYASAEARIVEKGDTLSALAARYLGDARLWKYLAVFNRLSSPYISASGVRLEGTLVAGDEILIPSTARPDRVRSSPSVLGCPADRSAEEQLYGSDFAKVLLPGKTRYGWEVAESGLDFRIAKGVPNLIQGVRTRMVVEKGTDVLYPRLGTAPSIGQNVTAIDATTVRFRIVSAILQDPRILSVQEVRFLDEGPDVLSADVTFEALGAKRPTRVSERL